MLKHLNVDEMVGLCAPWVTNAKRKAVFLSIAEIAPFHPRVVAVHTELLAVRPASEAQSVELRKLLAAEAVVDTRHDHLARAASSGIDADRAHCLAADPPESERAERADAIQRKLFPTGLNIVNASPLAESGNTARVAKLLEDEPEVGAFLKTIPVRGTKQSLLDTVQRWIAAGAELGKLERKREELEAKLSTKPADSATVTALRGRWIRLVTLVLNNLEVSEADPEAIETIRGPVLKASDRAGKRYEGAEPAGPADPSATPDK